MTCEISHVEFGPTRYPHSHCHLCRECRILSPLSSRILSLYAFSTCFSEFSDGCHGETPRLRKDVLRVRESRFETLLIKCTAEEKLTCTVQNIKQIISLNVTQENC